MAKGRREAVRSGEATAALRAVAPGTGAYAAESSFFQADWQTAYWGPHYQRLLEVKQGYDPTAV
jgi:hypothetical protein